MVPKIPAGDTAIFSKNKNGELQFRGMDHDEPYINIDNLPSFPEVYRTLGNGDSGGPVMKRITDSNREKRRVIVAVNSKGYGIDTRIYSKYKTKCIAEGSKLTKEIVDWIKEVDKGNYELGKFAQHFLTLR